MKFVLIFALVCSIIFSVYTSSCANPPTASGYTVERYQGTWYEVAKYQTAGGAYFQRNCTCTEINIRKLQTNTVNAIQGCIRNGQKIVVNATLIPTSNPGQYIEKIGPNSVGYWIIYLDSQHALTYDCNTVAGITNYCIHIISKNPHVDTTTIKNLAQKALDLGLNKNNLPIQITNQSDSICSRTKINWKSFLQTHKKISILQ